MRDIQIKVCGMKYPSNIEEVVKLNPQYIGFILYEKSPRYVNLKTASSLVKNIPFSIQRTGVLVNEPVENALRIAQSGVFDILQLHGNESVEYCKRLSGQIKIIKAFSISETLPQNMPDYQPFCTMFLFDTVGKNYGGTGNKFDHSLLDNYTLNTNCMLSGGISALDSTHIKSIRNNKMTGIDLNSRFEIEPGLKDINMLKKFIEKIRTDDNND
jgi:phosphoribosylanthranilate isomerase